jgi:5'(3')-deoxyribonucleotidase
MDGPLVDWHSACLRLFESDYTVADITEPRIHDLMGMSYEKLWKRIDMEKTHFWETLPIQPWANKLIEMAENFDPNFAFLTSPCESPYAAAGKITWLKYHFPKHAKRFILTPLKISCAGPGKLLIDDHEEYEEDWARAGGTFVLHPAPWNRLGRGLGLTTNGIVSHHRAHLQRYTSLCL